MDIGNTIAALRKERGVTQDELARAVGVSAQAASRWENGGSPDIELLPAIADFFDVSIDSLFGRNTPRSGINFAIADALADVTATDNTEMLYNRGFAAKRFELAFEYLWAIEAGLMGNTGLGKATALLRDYGTTIDSVIKKHSERFEDAAPVNWHSAIKYNDAFTLMSLPKNKRWFFAAERPEEGYESFMLPYDEYRRLFAELSVPGVLEAMLLTEPLNFNDKFTQEKFERIIAERSGISTEEAKSVCETLVKLGFIYHENIHLDEQDMNLICPNAKHEIIAALMILTDLINPPNMYTLQKS